MNNKNAVLYNSDDDDDTICDVEISEPLPQPNIVLPQNENVDNLAKNKSKAKKSKAKVPEDWNELINDEFEEKQEKDTPKKELFKCEFCQRGFIRNYHLNRHIIEQRCTVKREIDRLKEIELLEKEQKLNQKAVKKKIREDKKLLKEKENEANKEKEKAVVQKAVVQKPVIQKPVIQKQVIPRFVINFD